MKRIWKLQYEFADARINCFMWYHYSSWFIRFCAFEIWYWKKQYMYFFLPFGFINVIIFVLSRSGSFSTFVGADLQYRNSLRCDRSSWSELRCFNSKPSLKVWWRRARDFDGSQISSDLKRVSGFFNVFKFWNFKTSSFCVRHHFHHYIQYELLIENYCKSLLVYQ